MAWTFVRNLGILRTNVQAMDAFVQKYPDRFSWFKPLAGSVAFPRWKGEGSLRRFCQAVLDRQGVMIVPGDLFGPDIHHFRVGLGRRNFPEALEQVDLYLKNR